MLTRVFRAAGIGGYAARRLLADALRDGNPTALELFCLGVMVRASGARHIFEIGTFDGATTLVVGRVPSEG